MFGDSERRRVLRSASMLLCGVLVVAVASGAQALGQTGAAAGQPTVEPTPSLNAAPGVTNAAPFSPGPVDYFFPDLPATALVVDGGHFWFRPIFAMVGDYTTFSQDEASLSQVDRQENTQELRAGRLGFALRLKGRLKWEFYTMVDYQEARTREDSTFDLFDLRLRVPVGPVNVDVGKQKEMFSYELGALSVVLPQQERILLPFFPTRNVGVNLSGHLAGDRMTWGAGAFNDWLQTDVPFKRNANDYVGRVSALAWESPDTTKYLHLGLGLRHAGADDGLMRFAGRPESNVADKFVDTKDFSAKRAEVLSLEGLASHGRFSVLTEYMSASVTAPENADPHFTGYYVIGSWVVTGESRPYVRATGYAGGIRPKRRFGALEVVTRYSRLDLTDGPIDGGVLNKWHCGLNWWASAQWKIGISYGDADLDKGGLIGNTTMLLSRVQWLW